MTKQIITTTDAPTLAALAALLNDASAARRDWEQTEDGPEVPRVDERYDVTSLPAYGGEEPSDTMGIYSWDADSVLYADGNHPRSWVVQARDAE